MAFGILVQKFDLFLRTASESLAARALPAGSQIVGNIAGLLLIVLGGVCWLSPRSASARPRAISMPKRYGRARGSGWTLHSWRCASLLGAILFVYLVYTGTRWL